MQGGRRGASDELDSVECLQSGRDAWTSVAALTLQRTSLTAAAMDGMVFAIGGQVHVMAGTCDQLMLPLPKSLKPSFVSCDDPNRPSAQPLKCDGPWYTCGHLGNMPHMCRK